MVSFYVGTAGDTATDFVVHARSRCPAECFGGDRPEYLGEFTDAAQALAIARLRYEAICECGKPGAAWPWPAPLHPLAGAFIPPPP